MRPKTPFMSTVSTKRNQIGARIVILGDLAFPIRVGEMNDKILATFLAVLLPSLTFAQAPHNYQCSFGELQRRVEILYETGVTVPCEVHYFKDTEAPGQTQVLWRALNEAGYCERMAENFIGKLRDLGWSCAQGGAAAPAAQQDDDAEQGTDAAEGDDTEALNPAEDAEPTED